VLGLGLRPQEQLGLELAAAVAAAVVPLFSCNPQGSQSKPRQHPSTKQQIFFPSFSPPFRSLPENFFIGNFIAQLQVTCKSNLRKLGSGRQSSDGPVARLSAAFGWEPDMSKKVWRFCFHVRGFPVSKTMGSNRSRASQSRPNRSPTRWNRFFRAQPGLSAKDENSTITCS